jgi:hypothetical protein
MVIRKLLLSFVLLICLIGLRDGSSSSWAQSYSQLELDAKRIPWVRLFYQAQSFMVDVTVDMHLESLSADEVRAALIESHQGTVLPIPSIGAYKLTNDIVVDSIFQPPVKIVNQVWFDPVDATALGRIRLRQGEDDQKKVYRFTQQGVFRHRKEPKDQKEAQKVPEKWTDVKDSFYSYSLDQLGCINVSERLLLTYIVSAVEGLENNKPLVLCIFGKRQLFRVQLKSAGLHPVEIDFVEKKQLTEHRRQDEVEAHKIILESQPLEADLDEVENFSFLGFQKNIALFVHTASRLPVQISGEIPMAGKVTVKLHEVQLR